MTRLILSLLIGLICLSSSGPAATLRFLPWDDSIAARKLGFQDAKGTTELEDLHPHKRSKRFPVVAGETPPQLVAMDRTDAEGKPVTVPIKINPNFKSPLALIIPDPKGPAGVRCFVLEDDTGGFKWGSVRLLNATGKEIGIRYDKVVKLLPKTWTPVDIDPGGDTRNVTVQMATRDKPKDLIYSAVWEYEPNMRKLIFLVPGAAASTGSVDCKIIPEDRRTLAKEEAAKAADPEP